MITLRAYDTPQLSSCTLKAAQGPDPTPFPHLSSIGGDGIGTDRQASFAAPGTFLTALPLPSFSDRLPVKMSSSTRSKKAADDDAEPKPLSSKEIGTFFPPPTNTPFYQNARSSAYDRFMQEPYRAADRSTHLHQDGSNFAEWVASINRVLCVALNTELSVDDVPSSLENCSPQENRAISHFIDATLPPDFALCIGVIPARTTAKEFFDAIKTRCSPGNRFQKLKVVKLVIDLLVENGAGQPKPNSAIILSLRKSFALFKKLGIDADELEGLLAQTACHPPPSLDCVAFDQLVTSAILAKGDEKPSSTFVGQVILSTSRRDDDHTSSPFVYRVADSQDHPQPHQRPRSPYFARPMGSSGEVRWPPDHLVKRFGGACFHCGRTDRRSQNLSSPNYQREQVSQVKFVECDASDRVLIDTGASIHLSGSARFATNLKSVAPFRIFFADSNSSVTISQTTTLKIPVKHGFILVEDVPFSAKISGTILSVGRLCRAGAIPVFSALSLLLVFCNMLVTTSFQNDCWWVDVVPGEGTIVSAAETSSP
ncbi:hypothetical protein O181_011644 [Austropuccinia psidii MF-1]|uniref:Uncharacterized protein n=1 Tax=Austropuccinia psidii MF-1 TaxID=1389203 RepID=A0A9Q3BT66_9BASI|nr:hypothetical protein [Austropuccinia psidii MF-1]